MTRATCNRAGGQDVKKDPVNFRQEHVLCVDASHFIKMFFIKLKKSGSVNPFRLNKFSVFFPKRRKVFTVELFKCYEGNF